MSLEIMQLVLAFVPTDRKEHAAYGIGSRADTPEWELWRNLKLLCGNYKKTSGYR